MKYNKPSTTQGAWVRGADIVTGTKGKLVSETLPVDSGEYGVQDIAKIRINGDDETKNVRVNKPSIAGLISAFGEESKNWMNKELTLHTEKMLVAGRRVTALYLVPEGFELKEDEGGYLVITKVGESSVKDVNEELQDGEDIEVVESEL